MPFVLDASICAVWALTDESHPLAERAMYLLRQEPALVPAIWWFEMRNVLVISERRKRITADGSNAFLNFLQGFSILADEDRDEKAMLRLARKYQLSFYDAAYMYVAERHGLPLATLDGALSAAARAAGIPLLAKPTRIRPALQAF
jgi:predicted nucleic acid-binding protein